MLCTIAESVRIICYWQFDLCKWNHLDFMIGIFSSDHYISALRYLPFVIHSHPSAIYCSLYTQTDAFFLLSFPGMHHKQKHETNSSCHAVAVRLFCTNASHPELCGLSYTDTRTHTNSACAQNFTKIVNVKQTTYNTNLLGRLNLWQVHENGYARKWNSVE